MQGADLPINLDGNGNCPSLRNCRDFSHFQKFLPTATCSKAAHYLRISATRTAGLCRQRHGSFHYQTVLYICEAPWGYVVFILCFTPKSMNILQIDAGSDKDAGDSERTLVWEVLCSRPSKQSLGEECPVHPVWLYNSSSAKWKKLYINQWPIRCDWLLISEFLKMRCTRIVNSQNAQSTCLEPLSGATCKVSGAAEGT